MIAKFGLLAAMLVAAGIAVGFVEAATTWGWLALVLYVVFGVGVCCVGMSVAGREVEA